MGETEEFAPQSSHAEEEMVQEPAAEESVAPLSDAPAEAIGETPAENPTEVPTDDPVAAEDAQPETTDEPVGDPTDTPAEPGELDDIAAPVPAVAAVAPVPEPSAAGEAPLWPFLVYLGAWVVLAVAAVWQLLQLPADQVVYESTAYALTILGGLIMTAVGPLLILAVWLSVRSNRSVQDRAGLLTSALMKGALVTLGGAIIWWASLVTIDYLRLGRLL